MRLTSGLNSETGFLLRINECWITRYFILSRDFQMSLHATGTATCRPRFESHNPQIWSEWHFLFLHSSAGKSRARNSACVRVSVSLCTSGILTSTQKVSVAGCWWIWIHQSGKIMCKTIYLSVWIIFRSFVWLFFYFSGICPCCSDTKLLSSCNTKADK